VGGVLVVFAIIFWDKVKIDDPVGAISVHGVAGIWGLLAVCLSNDDSSIAAQFIGIATIFGFVFVASLITWYVIKLIFGIRVTTEHEYQGVDYSECGMEAYPEFTDSGK
jgi:Amt family ammonium transporter